MGMGSMASLFPWLQQGEQEQFSQPVRPPSPVEELIARMREGDERGKKLESALAASLQDGGPEKLTKGDVARNILANFARGALNARFGGNFDTVQEEAYKRRQAEQAQKRATLQQLLQLHRAEQTANTQMLGQAYRDQNTDELLAFRKQDTERKAREFVERNKTIADLGAGRNANVAKANEIKETEVNAKLPMLRTLADKIQAETGEINNRRFSGPYRAAEALGGDYLGNLGQMLKMGAEAKQDGRPQFQFRTQASGVDPLTGQTLTRDIVFNNRTGEKQENLVKSSGVNPKKAAEIDQRNEVAMLSNSIGESVINSYIKGALNPNDPAALGNWTGLLKGNPAAQAIRKGTGSVTPEESAYRKVETINLADFIKSKSGLVVTDNERRFLERVQGVAKSMDNPKTVLRNGLETKALIGAIMLRPGFLSSLPGGFTQERAAKLSLDGVVTRRVGEAMKALETIEAQRGNITPEKVKAIRDYVEHDLLSPQAILVEATGNTFQNAPKPQVGNSVQRPAPSTTAGQGGKMSLEEARKKLAEIRGRK